jgi:CubicO group peptidase (beta-lactamase class C family)
MARQVNVPALATLCLLAGCAAATSLPTPDARTIDALFTEYTGFVPGASVIVIRDGRVLYRRAYGLARLDPAVPATPATPATDYRLASLTKQFTATAIMLLERDGKLRYDQPVGDILPELAPAARPLTIRQLLTHTSGVWDYESLIPDSQTTQVSDRDILALLGTKDSVQFPAGTQFHYSNSAYVLLGLVAARVSGMSFPQFLATRVFTPLGMTHSLAYVPGGPEIPNRSLGYTPDSGKFLPTDQSVTSATLGDGGVYTSVDDLVKWDAALTNATLLDRAHLTQATTSATLADGTPTGYGFGWYVDRYHGHVRNYHHGETSGFRNYIVRFPDDRLTIIVLTNRSTGDLTALSDRLTDLFLPGTSR